MKIVLMHGQNHKGSTYLIARELAEKIGITPANLSILKNQKAKAIRFSTLNEICRVLDCQPGDILEYQEDMI